MKKLHLKISNLTLLQVTLFYFLFNDKKITPITKKKFKRFEHHSFFSSIVLIMNAVQKKSNGK
jgi:hypothetical protein